MKQGTSLLAFRVARFVFLLAVSWTVMTVTHELGHILGGTCCGGTLQSADLVPWRLPYSHFEPDPRPLVTLWSGLLFGVLAPVAVAALVQREWMWFIANFCVLANGTYIATAWFSGERYLDTARLLEHGASPVAITAYCLLTIGYGYVGFRRSCLLALAAPQPAAPGVSQPADSSGAGLKPSPGHEAEA